MAFVRSETWEAASAPAGAAPGGPFGSMLAPAWDLPVRRAAACSFSILVHICLLWFLINRLTDGTAAAAREKDGALALFDLPAPGTASPEPATPAKAPSPATPSVMDLSRPMDLPVPEWSMARIRVPRPMVSSQSAPASGQLAAAGGPGSNGVPRLSQFVGFGDSIGGELLLDSVMLEGARKAAIRAFPDSHGTALIFLRVSPAGIVMGVVIKGGSREIGLALRRELLGKKLFQVRSAISESALVALPPVSLSAVS